MNNAQITVFLQRRINVEPYQHWFKLFFKPIFSHILSIDDRNHSHYHCIVGYLVFSSLARYLLSCRSLTPHEVIIQLVKNK
ncbi:hypothetical protein C3432_20400 [Citrobacter amalonaticus]|uniref:Uncharacterized protein n=1 Tax=Citrobacter amalonaticus TaxID=35703 RepID=A0A2S4RVG0_CITAM|nr:hypothetical protein C3432_20400 [Citrobacter amalonaticus]POT74039.1 hypothetical protein C3436_17865 [Citrobacter amalonaticus]POU64141.1 hypothetical protein C3430_16800 [Citrobacter amalonaticus]POV03775.1 hypothetical protein C3424_19715 [Citrobacter amalonaticus]